MEEKKKQIKELTEDEGREILKFVFPNESDYRYTNLSLEPVIGENGKQQVSFSIRPLVGIMFHNGQDRCILHFDNTKAVLWLYNNGFDIQELLECNKHFSEMESDFENFAFAVEWMGKGEEGFKSGNEHKWTLDYVKARCKEMVENYYYKDYL